MADNKRNVERELRRMNAEWVSALVHKDAPVLARIMAADCSFSYPFAGDSKEQFIGDVESGDLTVESMARDNVDVRVFGQTAVVTGLDTAKWIYKGHKIEGYYTTIHVYAERDGLWQLVAVQACPVAR